MNVVFANEPQSKDCNSIFLAGPTPRSSDVSSWRPEAIRILRDLGFSGTVMVPERTDWSVKFAYEDQIEWEQEGLHLCKSVVFWVPRELNTMPAFTTNVEFGYWIALAPQKVFYGRPDEAPKNRYLDWMYKEHTGRTPINNLPELLKETVQHGC